MRRTPLIVAGLLGAVLLVTACTPGGAAEGDVSTPAPTVSCTTPVAPDAHEPAASVDEVLREELLGMFERDQAERLEGAQTEGDQARTDRLAEIVAACGWPGISLVGEDGEDAAWTIAQHSDLDPDFQAEALEWLRGAVEADDASPGNLAYLEDRVAVAAGEPQTYGTQVGCGEDGPEPATPIVDEAALDDRRLAAGLAPYAHYLAEMTEICAQQ